MRTTNIKVLAILMVMVFIFTGCGSKATFKNPDSLGEYLKKDENCIGLTVAVPIKDNGFYDNRLGILYSEPINGSLAYDICIEVEDVEQVNDGRKVAIVKIQDVRFFAHTYWVSGEIVE